MEHVLGYEFSPQLWDRERENTRENTLICMRLGCGVTGISALPCFFTWLHVGWSLIRDENRHHVKNQIQFPASPGLLPAAYGNIITCNFSSDLLRIP